MVGKSKKLGSMDRATKVSVSIPHSVVEAVRKQAAAEGRTFSNMVTKLLKEAGKEKAA